MKKIQLSDTGIGENVKNIGEALGGEYVVDCDEINLKLDDLKAEPRRKIFRKADAMIIAEARDILLERLTHPPTIRELARQVD